MISQQQLMAHSPPAREVVDVPVAEEVSQSFLAYGLSVITARAIPDVRDGLKPVQRRILWSMMQMGMRSDTPYRKSARIVGDTMGRYHPHGDAAIYDALVRLGQDFGRRVPLVDPQGNFGSLDDPPAAARYTECRLAAAAMDMVNELGEETVDFRPTYDGEGSEPVVLPAALPNLLVNGTTGIAVGMATNMAPHNLSEVVAAIELVMDRQQRGGQANTNELLKVLPGPDFPGGGRVVDQGLRQVYESGRGRVRVQAQVTFEKVTRLRKAIIIRELPYLVGPERVVAKVTALMQSGRLEEVTGIADLSDMEGLHIRIDLKPGANPDAVLRDLYRLTPLEEAFAVNNVVLVDGVPTTVGLRQMCEHYINHRLEVVERRTRYRLEKAERRLHLVDGLLAALDHIDDVVALIRSSHTPTDARITLMARFGLTEAQAIHILDMQLRRLTALEKQKLVDEAAELRNAITDYLKILASDKRRRSIVRSDLRRVAKDHGTPRRSVMVSQHEADSRARANVNMISVSKGNPAGSDVRNSVAGGQSAVPTGSQRDVACVVTVSSSGNLGRSPETGTKWASTGRHDLLRARAVTSTAAVLGLVTSQGRVFTIRAGEAAEANNRYRGAPVAPMLGLDKGEQVLGLVTEGEDKLLVVTKTGMVRRLSAASVFAVQYGAPAINLKPDDDLVAAFMVSDAADLVLVADNSKVLRVASADFSVSGSANGALGMKLVSDSVVLGAGVATDEGVIVTATNNNRLKSTSIKEFSSQRKGSQGVFSAKLDKGERLVSVAVVANADTDLRALKAHDDNPRRTDWRPVAVTIDVTKRYTAPMRAGRRIHVLAPGRW